MSSYTANSSLYLLFVSDCGISFRLNNGVAIYGHLYTSDINEIEIDHIKQQSAVGNLNYNYEAEEYSVLGSNRDRLTGEDIEKVKPVYRFFNTETGRTFIL